MYSKEIKIELVWVFFVRVSDLMTSFGMSYRLSRHFMTHRRNISRFIKHPYKDKIPPLPEDKLYPVTGAFGGLCYGVIDNYIYHHKNEDLTKSEAIASNMVGILYPMSVGYVIGCFPAVAVPSVIVVGMYSINKYLKS